MKFVKLFFMHIIIFRLQGPRIGGITEFGRGEGFRASEPPWPGAVTSSSISLSENRTVSTPVGWEPPVTLKLTGATLCWGLSFIAIKVALRGYAPITMVTLRLFLVTMILAAARVFRGGLEIRPKGRDLPRLAFLGFLNPFLAFLLESFGLAETSASLTSILLSTVPLFTPFAVYLAWKEPVGGWNIFGLALSFGGLAAIFLHGAGPAEYTPRGLFLLGAAVLTAIIYGIAVKGPADRYPPGTVLLYQQGFGFLFYLPVFLTLTDRSLIPAAGTGTASLWAIAFLALFPSAIAYAFYIEGFRKLGPSRTNAFINLTPVVAAAGSFLILGEPLGPWKLAGMGVVMLGVFISQASGTGRRTRG